jgi:hypothetical protein
MMLAGAAAVSAVIIGRRVYQKINKETDAGGPSSGVRVIFSGKNSPHVKWDDQEQAQRILAGKAVLAAVNHRRLVEPGVFLAEMPPRQDMYLIARAGVEKFLGRSMKEHLILVRHKGIFESRKHKKKRHKENAKAMDHAVELLKAQGVVLIAPDGGDMSTKWKPGAARLASGALEMEEAYVVMGHVPDAKRAEPLRLFFLRSNVARRLRISPAIRMSDIPRLSQVRELPEDDPVRLSVVSGVMQDLYNSWAGISPPGKACSRLCAKARQ